MTYGIKKVFITALTDVKTTDVEGVGTIRFEGNKVYKWVEFSGTTTVAVGDVLCYVAYASDGLAVIVDKGNTSLGAGIAMAAVTSGTVQYGWTQIKGISAALSTSFSTPVIGTPLTTEGASAGALAACSTTAATLATQQQCAISYDPTAKIVMCDFPF